MSAVKAIIFGFIVVFISVQLAMQIWDTILGPNQVANLGPGNNLTVNGTTETFMAMVPWMTAIGLVVTAVTVFVVGARRRL